MRFARFHSEEWDQTIAVNPNTVAQVTGDTETPESTLWIDAHPDRIPHTISVCGEFGDVVDELNNALAGAPSAMCLHEWIASLDPLLGYTCSLCGARD